ADQTICVTMTAAGSGTFASATVAKKMLLEEAPEKQVCIVDSRAIAGVLTLIIKRATELIEENLSYDHVCTTLLEYAKGLEMVAVLQCYDNLIKNGRVTPTVGKIAGHLHIKTIVAKSIHGTIEPIKKICGTKHVFEFMAEKIASKGDISNLPIVISHCKNETGVGMLVDILKEKYHATNISVLLCRGVTSFYAMPGGILVAY
ncbi:MAG: DegV family protein, partial [Oscillospiraceae bacterium]